jgi:hypothetical protein
MIATARPFACFMASSNRRLVAEIPTQMNYRDARILRMKLVKH